MRLRVPFWCLAVILSACGDSGEPTIIEEAGDACEGDVTQPVDTDMHAALEALMERDCSTGWRYCQRTCVQTPCKLAAGFPAVDSPACANASFALSALRVDTNNCQLDTVNTDQSVAAIRSQVDTACTTGCFPAGAVLCQMTLEQIYGL